MAQGGTEDDLFAPSITREEPTTTARPWRVESQGYVAFFGGVLAVSTIAFINCGRLGIAARRVWIVVIAVVALAAEIVFAVTAGWDSGILPFRVAAMLAFGGMYLLQRNADRRFHYYGGGEYSSLVGPGILAAILGLGTELFFLYTISGAAE